MKPERPALLTIICLAGFFFNGILGPILVYSPEIQMLGKAYALYCSLGFTLLIICFYGLWNMRRWAVWTLGTYAVVNLGVGWALGHWERGNLANLVILAISVFYYRRMR